MLANEQTTEGNQVPAAPLAVEPVELTPSEAAWLDEQTTKSYFADGLGLGRSCDARVGA